MKQILLLGLCIICIRTHAKTWTVSNTSAVKNLALTETCSAINFVLNDKALSADSIGIDCQQLFSDLGAFEYIDHNDPIGFKIKPGDVLYAVNMSKFSDTEKLLVASLQGLLAKHGVWLIQSYSGATQIWIKAIQEANVNIVTICESDDEQIRYDDLKSIVDANIDFIDGYVLCNGNDQVSINHAATRAGVTNAFIVPYQIVGKLNSWGIDKLYDLTATNLTEHYVYVRDNIDLFRKNKFVQPKNDCWYAQIDLAIKEGLVCFNAFGNEALTRSFFKLMDEQCMRLGWGTPTDSEQKDIKLGSVEGIYTLPGGLTKNLSVLSSTNGLIDDSIINQHYVNPEPIVQGKHYLLILMSDGDNPNWHLGNFASSGRHFDSKKRGLFKMNWGFPPLLRDLSPITTEYFYKNYSKNDFLITGPTGIGYTFPSVHKDLRNYAKLSAVAMNRVNQEYLIMLDELDFRTEQKAVIQVMAEENHNLKGVLYLDYNNYSKWQGDMYLVNNMPVVSIRYRFWKDLDGITDTTLDGTTYAEDMAAIINKQAASLGGKDITKPSAYTAIIVHAWSFTLDDVYNVIQNLDEDIIPVLAPTFFKAILDNVFEQ